MIKSAAQKNLLKTAAQNAQLLKTAGQKRDYLKRPPKETCHYLKRPVKKRARGEAVIT